MLRHTEVRIHELAYRNRNSAWFPKSGNPNHAQVLIWGQPFSGPKGRIALGIFKSTVAFLQIPIQREF